MIKLYKKYQEIINYLIAGGLTVLVTVLSYAFFTKILHIYYIVSNILAWIVAVIFAYVVNRRFVFQSKSSKIARVKEIRNFFIFRLLSLLIDTILMYLLVDIFRINDLISKMIVQIVVIVLNYIFSKFFIFKEKSFKISFSVFFILQFRFLISSIKITPFVPVKIITLILPQKLFIY